MQFDRIRLNGFKSFVDPTELAILPGLTGVVGPNGCGKSNLLEALRWVMGENRPTAMRGDGMEDVIFAGTRHRGARHFAEVAISIDNTARHAPAGFNDADQLEVIRRITRDTGSAYRINGREVRARDVQMLFADASTGAHSPALVRQGQISELINARPRARRRVLEEAAGISGLYQRRHEAELRLNATETNLERVADLIEALHTQLAQLARQARQAARYRQIGQDLRHAEGQLLYRRWREADTGLAQAQDKLTQAVQHSAQAERHARDAAVARSDCEQGLPALREESAIADALLQRLLVEDSTLATRQTRAREILNGLDARLRQIRDDIAREESLDSDAGLSLAQLAEEAAQLEADSAGEPGAIAAAADSASQANAALAEAEAQMADATEAHARLMAARDGALERRNTAARAQQAVEKAVAEARRHQVSARDQSLENAEACNAAQDSLGAAEREQAAADERLSHAEYAREYAQEAEAAARGARADTDGRVAALQAEVAALERILEQSRAKRGRVLDDIVVESGFEAALGAALADDLELPLIDDCADPGSGWRCLPDMVSENPLPDGAVALTAHVRAPAALGPRLLQTGVVSAEHAPELQRRLLPGQRLVSVQGGMWRWDGLYVAPGSAGSAATRHLQHANRLKALREELTAADDAAELARSAHSEARMALEDATAAEQAARQKRKSADASLNDVRRILSRAEAAREAALARAATATQALARHEEELETHVTALAEAEAALAALDDPQTARAAQSTAREKLELARKEVLVRNAAHESLRRETQARSARLETIARDRQRWLERLASARSRMNELTARQKHTLSRLDAARAEPEQLDSRRNAVQQELARARERCAAASEVLSAAESALRNATEAERRAERIAAEGREARARAEARMEAARDHLAEAAERIEEALDLTPQALLDQLDIDVETMPDSDTLDAEITRLRRARDALGAVNLRAEEDARAIQAEHDLLVSEKSDLESAVDRLRTAIQTLNREGRERLLAAFDQVNTNFSVLFRHLFGGGEARLVLVESDDPLHAGLEIMCQPPGKKLSTLSLLSGGEQTLTALALIFAVFLANPAPICVLDEVDAPLDDANVARFCDLLDEMTRRTETRFLIITHNAITMSRMDRLYGVTMAEPGVSQLVSVDLRRAEAMVA